MRKNKIQVSSGTYCSALAQLERRMMSQMPLTKALSDWVLAMLRGALAVDAGLAATAALDGADAAADFGARAMDWGSRVWGKGLREFKNGLRSGPARPTGLAWARRVPIKSTHQLVVLAVRANPEPMHTVLLRQAKCPVVQADPHTHHLAAAQRLELQRGVLGLASAGHSRMALTLAFPRRQRA